MFPFGVAVLAGRTPPYNPYRVFTPAATQFFVVFRRSVPSLNPQLWAQCYGYRQTDMAPRSDTDVKSRVSSRKEGLKDKLSRPATMSADEYAGQKNK